MMEMMGTMGGKNEEQELGNEELGMLYYIMSITAHVLYSIVQCRSRETSWRGGGWQKPMEPITTSQCVGLQDERRSSKQTQAKSQKDQRDSIAKTNPNSRDESERGWAMKGQGGVCAVRCVV